MKFRKSGEEFSSCHTARKITEENELGGNKKIDGVVFGTVIDAIICNNKITHRAMVSAFSVCYLESIFFCHGE